MGREVGVDVMVERGCGLDVHQAMVVACLLSGPAGAAATEGDPQLPDDDGGAAGDAGVVAGERLHARCHGEYRDLLAAGLCGA